MRYALDETNERIGTHANTVENRYVTLMEKVIRAGVKTKVLMLSATPVNNRFYDLRNQLQLAYEGNPQLIDDKLNTTKSIDEIFKNAQRVFTSWSNLSQERRTTAALLKMMDFDFFEVLDSVTIARSRKHIQKYYNTADIGRFPERLKPISMCPCLTNLGNAINYNEIYDQLMNLNLHIYTPTDYVFPSKYHKYVDVTRNNTFLFQNKTLTYITSKKPLTIVKVYFIKIYSKILLKCLFPIDAKCSTRRNFRAYRLRNLT